MNPAFSISILLALCGCAVSPEVHPLATFQNASVIATPASIISIADEVDLIWNPVPDASGYNVYVGFSHNSYDHIVPAFSTMAFVEGLNPGFIYHFAVSAINADGVEGDLSNDFAAAADTVLHLNFPDPGQSLQSSRDLMQWSARSALFTDGAWRVRMNPSLPMEFYRTVQ